MALKISDWIEITVLSASNTPSGGNTLMQTEEYAPPSGGCILAAGVQFGDSSGKDYSWVLGNLPLWGYSQGGWQTQFKRHATTNYNVELKYVYDDGDIF